MAIIIGLAGLRRAGKTTAADHLVERHGFMRLHPFNGGKAAVRAYFMHLGIDEETAWRMTDGDLKDTPCEKLPNNARSRDFMEPLGRFMGVEMGPEWTIGRELPLALESGIERLVVESVVYEDKVLRQQGGLIWRLNNDSRQAVAGLKTDEYTISMEVDRELSNNGSKADLHRMLDQELEAQFAIHQEAVPAGM